MDRVAQYLWIPKQYMRDLWGCMLSWDPNGETLSFEDGTTFKYAAQIGTFLEGVVASGCLPHYGDGRCLLPHFMHVLHFLYLLNPLKDATSVTIASSTSILDASATFPSPKLPALTMALAMAPAVKAYAAAGKQLRNAGVLFARLCSKVPPDPSPINFVDLRATLTSQPLMADVVVRWVLKRSPVTDLMPSCGPEAFEASMLIALEGYTPAELEHWMRYGCAPPPPEAAETLATALEIEPPKTLEEALASLQERERLAGAVPFVAQLVSALSLPPRKLEHQGLPLGGYADVTTRGHPEQLLPSAFAVDDLEFVRRFAEHELLFFRREEPTEQIREELILLLDQGVRTWGSVRLVLAAALIAFAKLAKRRKMPLRIGVTSDGKIIDPMEVDKETLGAMVEASDLSANPGAWLRGVMDGDKDGEAPVSRGQHARETTSTFRDYVLLTHPRNLKEPEVREAVIEVGDTARLFALSVDEAGAVALSQFQHGSPIHLRQLQVDMNATVSKPKPRKKKAEPLRNTEWTGDVEAIGYPFRVGTLPGGPRLFDFDETGSWLLIATANGMLHLLRSKGTTIEVLPRAVLGRHTLTKVERVLGVAGGFVVCGRSFGHLIVAHYELAQRHCKTHVLLDNSDHLTARWFYVRKCNSVVAGLLSWIGEDQGWHSLSLFTNKIVTDRTTGEGDILSDEVAACRPFDVPPPELLVCETPNVLGRCLIVDRDGGRLVVQAGHVSCYFHPTEEGMDLVADGEVKRACYRGNVLAVTCLNRKSKNNSGSLIILGNDGIALGSLPAVPDSHEFILSHDGAMIARHLGNDKFEIRNLHDLGGPPSMVKQLLMSCSVPVIYTLGEVLIVKSGKCVHTISWKDQSIRCQVSKAMNPTAKIAREMRIEELEVMPIRFCAMLDRERFPKLWLITEFNLFALTDVYGQIALFNTRDELLCMIYVLRTNFAAWMPDGTRMGPPWLTGGPASPDAAEKLGKMFWNHTHQAGKMKDEG